MFRLTGHARYGPPALVLLILSALTYGGTIASVQDQALRVNDREYFETQGLNVLVFSSQYNGLFFDEKTAGIELIHHGVRTATGGAVRLKPTPEQWDQIPRLVERKVDRERNTIDLKLRYDEFDFDSRVSVRSEGRGFWISVSLDEPLQERLEGRAGFNLEFLPSAYFGKTYLVDGAPRVFPLYPSGPIQVKPAETQVRQFEGYTTFDDRPFLWGENEYVIGIGAHYVFLAHAVAHLVKEGGEGAFR
jgi:endoglucanase